MNIKSKILTLTTAILIAFAPTTASAMSNLSDGIFSWPTDYKAQKAAKSTSKLDGKVADRVKNLEIKKPVQNKKRK